MQKFNLSIDVSKIQKERLRQNSFTTKDGEVTQTLCDIVVVPLKERKLIKEGDGWNMYKSGFAVEKGTKEETTNILGDVMEFESTQPADQSKNQSEEVIDESQIPF